MKADDWFVPRCEAVNPASGKRCIFGQHDSNTRHCDGGTYWKDES